MGDNPGQADASISVGATIDQASVDATLANFKAQVAEAMKAIQDLAQLPSSQYTAQNKQDMLSGMFPPEVLTEAKKQLADVSTAVQGIGTTTESASAKTTAALENMGADITAYRAKVDGLKEAFSSFATGSGASLTDIQKVTVPQLAPGDVKAGTQAISELKTEEKNLQDQNGALQGSTVSLGDVFRLVFGVTIMQLAVQAVRTLINTMKEAIQAGLDYTTTLFRLAVAVRDMQRGGADVTIKDFTDMAAKLQKSFPTFSLQSMVSGISDAVLLTKELGFTKDEMGEVAKASITLASIWGKDVNEVMRTMALTLSSGYSEGLQRLGININKIVITEKAHTMGIKENYNAMTQAQRAAAALAVILEQTNGMMEDATKYQETAAGKVDKLTAAWTDLKRQLGQGTLGVLGFLASILTIIVKEFGYFDDVLKLFDASIFTAALIAINVPIGLLIVNLSTLNKILHGEPVSFKEYWDEVVKVTEEGVAKAIRASKSVVFPSSNLGDTTATPKAVSDLLASYGLSADDEQTVLTAMEDLNTQLSDLAQQGADKLAQIETDKARDLEKIDETLHRDLEQAELDYQRTLAKDAQDNQRKLADIDLKNSRARADAQTSLNRDLAKDEQDYENSVADAKLKYQQSLIDNESKYQLKIKQMQEQYLFDIDEALRTGNAKQALEITRKLKLEYGQAQENHDAETGQMKTDFDRQMAELERQRLEKIQQRQQEFQQKLADLAIQAQQERADEAVRYQQQLVDEATQYAQKRADLQAKAVQDRIDRETQYQQQLQDLAKSQNDQYKTIAEGLLKQYNLTNKMLEAVYKSYLLVYGPGGGIDKIYAYAVASAQKAGNDIGAALGGAKPLGNSGLPGTPSGPGYAEGGSFIASRPMSATFGERGTELVQVTPLSYLGKNTGKLFGNLPVSVSGGHGNGSLDIQILLSSDLEARIVNSSVDKMSDIMVSVEREGR